MLSTTLCYPERDGKYLLLHRVKKQNDINHDKWIGIGGKCEEGESPEDCMEREFCEETGMKLTAYRYRGLVTFVSDRYEGEYMHLFTASDWSGTPRECDEGDLAWIEKEALLSLPIWEGDKIFLKLLERGDPFFSLKLRYVDETLEEAVLNGRPLPLPDWEAAL